MEATTDQAEQTEQTIIDGALIDKNTPIRTRYVFAETDDGIAEGTYTLVGRTGEALRFRNEDGQEINTTIDEWNTLDGHAEAVTDVISPGADPEQASPDPEADQAKPEQADTPTISNEQAAQLEAARKLVKRAEQIEADAKESHKEAKARRDELQEAHNLLEDDILSGQRALFGKDAPVAAE